MQKYLQTTVILTAGIFLGALLVLGVRMTTYDPKPTHYHANFGVYIDGVREEFKSFTYYEEVSECTLDTAPKPAHRAHMHQPKNDVVHVHDNTVTWGNFFENIGFGVGQDYLATRNGIFANSDTKKVTYNLNGKVVDTIANRVIDSEDILLVSYGVPDQMLLQQQVNSIDVSAHHFNETADPAACSGSANNGWKDRFKHAF